jgi:predicted esterase
MAKRFFSSIISLLLFLALAANAKAQQESLIVYPPGFDIRREYPVVFIFPGVGGTSLELAQYLIQTNATSAEGLKEAFSRLLRGVYPRDFAQRGFILALPPEKADLAVGLEKILQDAEKRIFSDLDLFKAKYSLNVNKVIVSGFSLSGDISFALLLRNPKDFSGAVVMSSRCSYKGNLATLASKRLYLTMGERDPRKDAMKQVKAALDKYKIANKMVIIPKRDHFPPPVEEFLSGVAFSSGE